MYVVRRHVTRPFRDALHRVDTSHFRLFYYHHYTTDCSYLAWSSTKHAFPLSSPYTGPLSVYTHLTYYHHYAIDYSYLAWSSTKHAFPLSSPYTGLGYIVGNIGIVSRWCECSRDVHLCSLNSALVNLTIHMQLSLHTTSIDNNNNNNNLTITMQLCARHQ
jgi:hypothetical protein